MKVLQINTSVNYGSTGRIAEDIGRLLLQEGHESHIAYGRSAKDSKSDLIKIGNRTDLFFHYLRTRIFDRHGFGSKKATKKFVHQLELYKPDIIHLHNIHGYYLNIKVLFEYIKKAKIPVVWTFHDCWPFTGHCSYFDSVDCYKWQTECFKCPNIKGYPASWYIDNSRKNFMEKRRLLGNVDDLNIVTPSKWLAEHVKRSFLKIFPVKVIYNGVDLNIFKPNSDKCVFAKFSIPTQKYILGVANVWDDRKGFFDFLELRKMLPSQIGIVLVGLKDQQLSNLSEGMIGVKRTENVDDLAKLYSNALAFVNPTYVDNFPTTNIEALACGTRIVTYTTGGSPEAVDQYTGEVIEKGDLNQLSKTIISYSNDHADYTQLCRNRAIEFFSKENRYQDYLNLYSDIINQT
jgi:putative colanic acid biosynthesis glycosyltransferase